MTNRDSKTLTSDQAYAAMFHFLDGIYQVTKSDDLGGLLGSLSLLSDGIPADPAVAEDWRRAVDFALSGGKADSLKLSKL